LRVREEELKFGSIQIDAGLRRAASFEKSSIQHRGGGTVGEKKWAAEQKGQNGLERCFREVNSPNLRDDKKKSFEKV